MKPDSSFNDGMKPLLYSKKEEESRHLGWMRVGEDISYYQNPNTKTKLGNNNLLMGNGGGIINGYCTSSPSNYYTLSFKVQFKHDQDEVYFAYCYPYTYTDC